MYLTYLVYVEVSSLYCRSEPTEHDEHMHLVCHHHHTEQATTSKHQEPRENDEVGNLVGDCIESVDDEHDGVYPW